MIPDRNQVVEALPAAAMWAQQTVQGCDEFDAVGQVLAVAQAFVDGKLIPAEVDYEAAARAMQKRWEDDGEGEPYRWDDLAASDRDFWISWAKKAVDAALHPGGETNG